jgi:hypothetical protein
MFAPKEFLNDKQNADRVSQFIKDHPDLASELLGVPSAFNPVRESLLGNRKPVIEPGKSNLQTETLLDSSPNPSAQGQSVTFTATVRFIATKAPVLQGFVTFDMHTGGDVHLIQPKLAIGGLGLVQLGRAPITNGVATLATDMLRKGIIRVSATFGGWGDILGSRSGEPNYSVGLGQEVR